MATSDRLIGVRTKIERAKQHIRDVEVLIDGFGAFHPYEVGEKRDPQTGQKVFYMTRVEPVPIEIGSVAADALSNLRIALDHLAMQLSIVNGGSPDSDDIYFPIKDATKYKPSSPRVIGQLGKDAVDIIDAAETYEGGAGHDFWVLSKLNNIEKHRRLNLIGTTFGGFWVDPEVLAIVRAQAKANPSIIGKSPLGYYFRPESDVSPLKVGDELYRCPGDKKLDENAQFSLLVAFGEPSIGKDEPVVAFLHQMSDRISGLADQLSPLL